MYDQKEYMEEYLKFKDVVANMKKWEKIRDAVDFFILII